MNGLSAASCFGRHRAMVVAKLLEKRQAEIEAEVRTAHGVCGMGLGARRAGSGTKVETVRE